VRPAPGLFSKTWEVAKDGIELGRSLFRAVPPALTVHAQVQLLPARVSVQILTEHG
jgi:hypothetical protein